MKVCVERLKSACELRRDEIEAGMLEPVLSRLETEVLLGNSLKLHRREGLDSAVAGSSSTHSWALLADTTEAGHDVVPIAGCAAMDRSQYFPQR
mmetsp:Transcript_126805/g.353163  ORF Transcript_126805/g.353163 Transcript_126805/m.353163 type:complete len:94 (+) Transcript_126805:879-1160(+)